ncbi:MAG TPA: SEC-C metal-binding domain-containing protein, partial [Planctomycetota bacterium]|nr:SEC-C metal-binding domain-containing protein [Planctomycetota bacterium]
RRIDNQLRGRCARQGDPGSSQFFMSLEDDLFRKFAPPWMKGLLRKMGLKEGERIESKLVTRAIGKAQKNVESHNFDIRKNLVEYDQVRNQQRKVVYGLRQRILDGADVRETILDMVRNRVAAMGRRFLEGREPDNAGFANWFQEKFGGPLKLDGPMDRSEIERIASEEAEKLYRARPFEFGVLEVRHRMEGLGHRFLKERNTAAPDAAMFCHQVQTDFGVAVDPTEIVRRSAPEAVAYAEKRVVETRRDQVLKVGEELFAGAERFVLLGKIDEKWKDLLYNMDQLRDVIGLRSYAQSDPKIEYKRDATALFEGMMEALEEDVTAFLFKSRRVSGDEQRLARRWGKAAESKQDVAAFEGGGGDGGAEGGAESEEKPKPFVATGPKVGRNDPCPCGSGKKYKKCHGTTAT